MKATAKFAIAVSFITLSTTHVAAQVTGNRELEHQYAVAAIRTIEVAKTEAEPYLTDKQRMILHSARLEVDPSGWDVYGTSADENVITIPLGLIILQDHIDTALAITQFSPVSEERLLDYIHAFMDVVYENLENPPDEMYRKLPHFPTFIGISSEQINKVTSTADFISIKEAMKLSTFSVIYFHELAHLVEPDWSEAEADAFAIRVSNQAGMSSLGGFYQFLVFAALEDSSALATGQRNSSAQLCRAVNMYLHAQALLEQNPEFIAFARERGFLSKWRKAPKEMARILADDDVKCQPHVQAPK